MSYRQHEDEKCVFPNLDAPICKCRPFLKLLNAHGLETGTSPSDRRNYDQPDRDPKHGVKKDYAKSNQRVQKAPEINAKKNTLFRTSGSYFATSYARQRYRQETSKR